MKVHRVKIKGEVREYMCLTELGNQNGCQMCGLCGPKLVESKLRPPKDITSICKTCDSALVSFLELPDEQKIVLWPKEELNVLIQERVYCPECRTAYLANNSCAEKQ